MPATPMFYILIATIGLSAIVAAIVRCSIWLDNKAMLDDWYEEYDEV